MKYRTYHTTEDGREEEWRFEFYNDRTISADPCPYCGSKGFWNAAWEVHGQFAQVAKDDERGESALDSADVGKIQYIGCGNCGEDLTRKGDSDLDPERIPEKELRPNPNQPAIEDRVWGEGAEGFGAEDNPTVSDHAVGVRSVTTVDDKSPTVSLAIHRERVQQREVFHVTTRVDGEKFLKLGLHDSQREANGQLKRKQKSLDFISDLIPRSSMVASRGQEDVDSTHQPENETQERTGSDRNGVDHADEETCRQEQRKRRRTSINDQAQQWLDEHVGGRLAEWHQELREKPGSYTIADHIFDERSVDVEVTDSILQTGATEWCQTAFEPQNHPSMLPSQDSTTSDGD